MSSEVILLQKDIKFRNSALSASTKRAYRQAVIAYYSFIQDHGLLEGAESVHIFLEYERNRLRPASYNLRIQALKEYFMNISAKA